MEIKKLISLAIEASKKAYAPYSNFAVGAVCLTTNGRMYSGANIENASYSLSCCAERVAIFNAVNDGQKQIDTIVVFNSQKMPYPCGACRQVMSEFGKDMTVIIAKSLDDYKVFKLSEIFPYSFDLS